MYPHSSDPPPRHRADNLVEPGEKILVGVGGIWGSRVVDMATRLGCAAVPMNLEAGRNTFSLAQITRELEAHKPAVLFLCQGESSTGAHQSLAGISEVCKRTGTLLLVDTVCSLGGVPFMADQWGVDAMYSGSQKCLSGPPGAAPLFVSERAMEKIQVTNKRETLSMMKKDAPKMHPRCTQSWVDKT